MIQKIDGRTVAANFICFKGIGLPCPVQSIDHALVGPQYPLGLSRGPRGVNHIGQIVCLSAYQRILTLPIGEIRVRGIRVSKIYFL